MRKNCIAFCVGILAALAIVGCGASDEDVIGKWTAKGRAAMDDGNMSPGMADVAEMIADMKSTKLELRKDHTFTMDGYFAAKGTWKLKGNDLTLSMTEVRGLASERQTVLHLSEDGRTLNGDDQFFSKVTEIEFTRDDG